MTTTPPTQTIRFKAPFAHIGHEEVLVSSALAPKRPNTPYYTDPSGTWFSAVADWQNPLLTQAIRSKRMTEIETITAHHHAAQAAQAESLNAFHEQYSIKD